MARILGVDPGLRHTGWAVVDMASGRLLDTGLIVYPEDRPIPSFPGPYIEWILRGLDAVLVEHAPGVAAVEQVTWYGSRQRVTLPLSHVAGAIVGYLLAKGLDVFLLLAGMKRGGRARGDRLERRLKVSRHEVDAAMLAWTVRDDHRDGGGGGRRRPEEPRADAGGAEGSSTKYRLSPLGRRRISARKDALSRHTKHAGVGSVVVVAAAAVRRRRRRGGHRRGGRKIEEE